MLLRLLLVASLGFAACSADHGPRPEPSPSHASLFGQVDVTLAGDLSALGDIRSVSVGGIAAYDLRPTAAGLTVTLQGAPTPGAVAIEVIGARGSSLHQEAFTYDPPPAGVPLASVLRHGSAARMNHTTPLTRRMPMTPKTTAAILCASLGSSSLPARLPTKTAIAATDQSARLDAAKMVNQA